MKKIYIAPESEVLTLNFCNVIATSGEPTTHDDKGFGDQLVPSITPGDNQETPSGSPLKGGWLNLQISEISNQK